MKIELDDADLTAIAAKVIEHLHPLLANRIASDVDDTILTVEELCHYLKVDQGWVYQQVHSKDIPFLKAGRFLRFRKSEIDKYLRNNAKN